MNRKEEMRKAERRLRTVLRNVFNAGEQWGITHSTWFIPSKRDAEEKANAAIDKAVQALKRKERKPR